MNRRELLSTLGALASTRWCDNGWNPSEWDGFGTETGRYTVLDTDGIDSILSLTVHAAGFNLQRTTETESTLSRVHYSSDGIFLDVESRTKDHNQGYMMELSPDEAREFAVALYMAAEEYEARTGGGQ